LRKANPKKVAVITEDNNIIKEELERRSPRPIKTNRGQPFWDISYHEEEEAQTSRYR
jgi:hypothetical protein